MAACAITTVKTVVLQRFHLFYFFIKLVSWGMVLGSFLVTFGDPGDTFSDFRGYRNRDCGRDRGRDRDRDSLGGPRLRQDVQLRVTSLSSWAVGYNLETFWL